MPTEFIRYADLVSEMVDVKHHFSRGVKARRGIEY
jgi:cob(I)alamin adenosyltransferase